MELKNKILDFQNGIFEGKVLTGYKLSSYGIFISDDSSFLAGKPKLPLYQN